MFFATQQPLAIPGATGNLKATSALSAESLQALCTAEPPSSNRVEDWLSEEPESSACSSSPHPDEEEIATPPLKKQKTMGCDFTFEMPFLGATPSTINAASAPSESQARSILIEADPPSTYHSPSTLLQAKPQALDLLRRFSLGNSKADAAEAEQFASLVLAGGTHGLDLRGFLLDHALAARVMKGRSDVVVMRRTLFSVSRSLGYETEFLWLVQKMDRRPGSKANKTQAPNGMIVGIVRFEYQRIYKNQNLLMKDYPRHHTKEVKEVKGLKEGVYPLYGWVLSHVMTIANPFPAPPHGTFGMGKYKHDAEVTGRVLHSSTKE